MTNTFITLENWQDNLDHGVLSSSDGLKQFISDILALQKQSIIDEAAKRIEEKKHRNGINISMDSYALGQNNGMDTAQDIIRNI